MLTRLLFGVDVPVPTGQNHWDLTTLVLKKALARRLVSGMEVLEIGAGEAAVLSVFAARRGARVTSADLREEAVRSASAVAQANGVRLELHRSDLLSAVPDPGRFELMLFNPPYVPRSLGQARRLGEREPAAVWDGGKDGLQVLGRFVREVAELPVLRARVLLGFNRRYLPAETVARLASESGLTVTEAVSRPANPSMVLVLRRG